MASPDHNCTNPNALWCDVCDGGREREALAQAQAEIARLREILGPGEFVEKSALDQAQAERDGALGFIERRGYRRCDIPACNCPSWHGGHAEQRLTEIYEALGGCNGTLPVPEINRLRARLGEAEALLREARKDIDHQSQCDKSPAVRHCALLLVRRIDTHLRAREQEQQEGGK